MSDVRQKADISKQDIVVHKTCGKLFIVSNVTITSRCMVSENT